LQRDPYEFGPPHDVRKSDHRRLNGKTPFLTLLAQGSDCDLVNGTFDKIFARYRYWVDVLEYSPVERVILLVLESARMIGGGGFDYLFTQEIEGDPDFRIAAEAHSIAGIARSYEAFQEAFALFPGGVVPHDPQERSRLYEAANKSARERLNRKVWYDEYDRERKLAEFIRAHAADLGDLDSP
jgi:hypothetical protein